MSRSIILDLVEKFRYNHISKLYRNFGKKIYLYGEHLTKDLTSFDEVQPCLRELKYNNSVPDYKNASFMAPNIVMNGSIIIGENSSVYYNCILNVLGKNSKIIIGNNVVIQDLSSLYAEDGDIIIDDDVVIGVNCTIYNCKLSKGTVIGHNSVVNKGTETVPHTFVGAGSHISKNTAFKNSEIVAGNPSSLLRPLTETEMDSVKDYHEELVKLSEIHNEISYKSVGQIIDKEDYNEYMINSTRDEKVEQKLYELGYPNNEVEDDFHEIRFDEELTDYSGMYNQEHKFIEYNNIKNFPKAYEIYKNNFEKYEESKKFFDNKDNEKPLFINDLEEKKNIRNN